MCGVSGFGFGVWCFGSQVSGRVSGVWFFVFRVSDFGCRVSGCGTADNEAVAAVPGGRLDPRHCVQQRRRPAVAPTGAPRS